jgi:membrane protease subunit HflK
MTNGRFGSDGPRVNLDLPDIPLKYIRVAVLALLAVVLVINSVYTVQPEEIAVVLRFGAFDSDRIGGPGLHFKVPLMDRVIKVPVQRQLKQEFGFRTVGVSAGRSDYQEVPDESNMLTGDLNAAVVEWEVQYRISDPEKYLFHVRNVADTFRDMSEAVMRQVVGDRTVNEVLTIGRTDVENTAETKLQELAEQYETGITVDQVILQDVNPPDRVRPSFNEVNQAQQEKEQKINIAQKEFNQEIPAAEGEALRMVQEAEGYKIGRINRAEGEATRFRALFTEYSKAPEVTRRRIYLETMGEILPKVGSKVVIDEQVEGLVPLLGLGNAQSLPQRLTEGGNP